MPHGLSVRGQALPLWMSNPHQTLSFSAWWHQGVWAREVLRVLPNRPGTRQGVLTDVIAWAEQAVHAPWCRHDVARALIAWALDVHEQRVKPAWEHAADLEALLTLVRPNMDDPRLLRWAHPDAVWQAWSGWDSKQRSGAAHWMTVQASSLMVMAHWWRRACAPDDRPGGWYGVKNPWSLTVQGGWVQRWSERIMFIVQDVLMRESNGATSQRLHWVRWMDRMLFEGWKRHGVDDGDLLPIELVWHNWVRTKPWRSDRSLSPSRSSVVNAVALIVESSAQRVDKAMASSVPSPSWSPSSPPSSLAAPSPIMAPDVAGWNEPWALIDPNAWGHKGTAPIVNAFDPAGWPQDTMLWWLHRKGERSLATCAWNTLWSASDDRQKINAMLVLSESYGSGAHGLSTSLLARDRWKALFNHARSPSLEWIGADDELARASLQWIADDSGNIVPVVQGMGPLPTRAAWTAWLMGNERELDQAGPVSLAWRNAWRAHRAVLRHGPTLMQGPRNHDPRVWKTRWEVWVNTALSWETTLSKVPGVGQAWSRRFRQRITDRLLAHADRLPHLESWESMSAWLNSETKPRSVWESVELTPTRLSAAKALKILAKEPVLDRSKELDLKIVVDRCAALWNGCVQVPAPAQAVDLAMVLNEQFPWFEVLTQRLTRRLAMRHRMGAPLRLPNVLLVGPPGIGKTSYVRALAAHLHVPFAVLGLNGMADNRLLAGTSRGYSNMRPAWPVEFVAREQCANPLLVLDEIDKVSQGQQTGRVWDTLLGLTEPSSAKTWFDECLLTPVDLSGVSWLATANQVHDMPDALLSRFEVIDVSGPDWTTRSHQRAALRRIQHDLAQAWGCADLDRMPWLSASQEAQLWYRPWPSLRHLARAVENVVETQVLQRPSPAVEPEGTTINVSTGEVSASTTELDNYPQEPTPPWQRWVHNDNESPGE